MNSTEGFCSRLPFRHVPCFPPLLRLAHTLQTPESSPERRIVERASELKRFFEKTILLIVHTKRKFDDVGTLKSSKAPTNYFMPNILRKSWSRLVVSVVHLDALAFPVAAT